MSWPFRLGVMAAGLLLASSAVADPGWPVLHHDVEVRLEPADARLEATDRLRLAAAPDLDRPLSLLLHRDLNVEEIRLGGRPLVVRTLERWRPRDFWSRPDYAELAGFAVARQHEISPPEGGWPGGEVELELRYAGSVYDSLAPPDVAYGRGFETTTGLVDPRGAFLTAQTFWVPWTAEDRFTFRVRTELPPGWHSMSQGARSEHGERDGVSVTVWTETRPQEQIYLVAGPYVVRERTHEGVHLYTYTYSDTPAELCETYLDAAARYLELYGERIGPYPFEKWAMVENWWQTGFGMPGFTLLGDRVIRLPFIVDTSYGHEILHCWWGNGVYVDYATGNWCEGLTAHGADYLYKTWESAAAARDYRRAQLVGYLDFASIGNRDFPLRDFRERSDFGTQAVGYGKAMMVFHMLEREIGEEAFLEGLSVFYDEWRSRVAGWSDLEASFSSVAGRDLSRWFEQWVQRPGAPHLSLGATRARDGGIEIELRQDAPAYSLQVPVRVARGDGEPRELRVQLEGATTWVPLPADATAVVVDPDFDLFRRLYREEIPPTLSQGLGADSSLVVIGAANPPELAEALREVARQWSQNQDMRVLDEQQVRDSDLSGRALFLLGPGPMATRAMEAAQSFGEEAATLPDRALQEGRSLIFATRDPEDPEIAWTVVLPAAPEVAEALGRKMPHYSRYSWLLFDGEQNVGKGAWTVRQSPLHRPLEKESR